MSKYTRLIYVIYFDQVTRFLCSDWLKWSVIIMALVVTLSVKLLTTKAISH